MIRTSTSLFCATLLACAAAGASAQVPQPMKPPKLVAIDAACRPIYPSAALRAKAQGETVIEFSVDEQGMVVNTRITQPSGPTTAHRMLDAAAANSLAQCHFVPATDGQGMPVPGLVRVTYDWSIEHAPADAQPGPRPAVMNTDDPSCKPVYPQPAVQAHAQGTTVLWYRIDAQGRVIDSRVVHPSGPTPEHALLDQAALTTLARCPIEPGVDGSGQPAETSLRMEQHWTLE